MARWLRVETGTPVAGSRTASKSSKEVHPMNEHTYWNSNGPEQAKYDEMEAAAF